jgi:hypothetical protein
MRRQLPGLSEAAGGSQSAIPDGVFLVRIECAQYRWHAQKPFYGRLSVLEPEQFKEHEIVSRLYCTPKAMWKLGWFLRDFIYDPELLSQNEVDERALRGLVGVVKISHSHTVINGFRLPNLDGFADRQQMAGAVHLVGRIATSQRREFAAGEFAEKRSSKQRVSP